MDRKELNLSCSKDTVTSSLNTVFEDDAVFWNNSLISAQNGSITRWKAEMRISSLKAFAIEEDIDSNREGMSRFKEDETWVISRLRCESWFSILVVDWEREQIEEWISANLSDRLLWRDESFSRYEAFKSSKFDFIRRNSFDTWSMCPENRFSWSIIHREFFSSKLINSFWIWQSTESNFYHKRKMKSGKRRYRTVSRVREKRKRFSERDRETEKETMRISKYKG